MVLVRSFDLYHGLLKLRLVSATEHNKVNLATSGVLRRRLVTSPTSNNTITSHPMTSDRPVCLSFNCIRIALQVCHRQLHSLSLIAIFLWQSLCHFDPDKMSGRQHSWSSRQSRMIRRKPSAPASAPLNIGFGFSSDLLNQFSSHHWPTVLVFFVSSKKRRSSEASGCYSRRQVDPLCRD